MIKPGVFCCLLFSFQSLAQEATEIFQLEIPEANPSLQEFQDQIGQVDQAMLEKKNLNEVSWNEIMAISYLDIDQKQSLIDFLKENRPLFHFNELQTVYGLEEEDLILLSAQFMVSRNASAKDLKQKLKSPDISFGLYRVKTLIQKKRGFEKSLDEGGFQGNPFASRFRFIHRKYGEYSFGLLLDKDAGEPGIREIKNPIKENYWSAHAYVEPGRILKKLCVGDFYIQQGEGLIFSQGFSMGKGPETIYSIKKPEPGLKPYSSSFEKGNFRGIATTIEIKGMELTSYFSQMDLNAKLYSDADYEDHHFKSLNSSGTFRTISEQQNLNSLPYRSVGGYLKGRFLEESLSVNLNLRNDQLGYSWVRKGEVPVESGITHYGASFSFQKENLFTFGEVAFSQPGEQALILGSIIQLTEKLDMGILLRKYSKSYLHLSANPFGEFSGGRNEQGTYISFRWMPDHRLSIEGYSDIYSRLAPQNGSYLIPSGLENLVHFRYRKSRSDIFRLVLRSEKRKQSERVNEDQYLRTYLSYQREFSQYFRTNSKFLFNRFEAFDTQSGFGLVQEFIVGNSEKSISAMVCLFDTESHNTAIYLFEKNLYWEYSIPSFSGSGMHLNILAKLRPARRVSLWVRVNHTSYLDKERIGSGLDEIEGNKKTELAGMLRLSLF